MTIVQVPPYTECPQDKKRFKDGLGASMAVTSPGVCTVVEQTGVVLDCPPGFQLITQDSSVSTSFSAKISNLKQSKAISPGDDGEEIDFSAFKAHSGPKSSEETIVTATVCKGRDIIPEVFAIAEQKQNSGRRYHMRTKGSDKKATWTTEKNTGGGPCPIGYKKTLEGCVSHVTLPPFVRCPPGWRGPDGTPINPYAFRGKQYTICDRALDFKGKTWCPTGFEMYGEPWKELELGDLLPPGQPPVDISTPTCSSSKPSRAGKTSGSLLMGLAKVIQDASCRRATRGGGGLASRAS
eukprot:Selendium_serpulae@DN4198_c0_g1_i4.p1